MKVVSGLGALAVFAGCAAEQKPWQMPRRAWYQADVDSSERSFFYGTFLDRGGH